MNIYNDPAMGEPIAGFCFIQHQYSLDRNSQDCGSRKEYEFLEGVALKDGCYCKHYKQARDWKEKERELDTGLPYMQHYCMKEDRFRGHSNCCWGVLACFEKGKSASVKRILNKIRKSRINRGIIL